MNVLMSIRRTAKLCLFAVMTAIVSPAMAQVIPQPQTIIPAPPQLAASSWILMDANSGRILAEHNSDERLPPASLTKLMTAYLVERELDRGTINLTDMVNVSENAWRTGGSKMFMMQAWRWPSIWRVAKRRLLI